MAARKENAIPRLALTRITTRDSTPKKYMETKAAKNKSRLQMFFTAFLLKSHTDFVKRAATATLIPERAF